MEKKYSSAFITAEVRNRMMQVDVKLRSLQTELGIKAGLSRFSCRRTHKVKAGAETTARQSRTMLVTL